MNWNGHEDRVPLALSEKGISDGNFFLSPKVPFPGGLPFEKEFF
jgi:hypothetical protein